MSKILKLIYCFDCEKIATREEAMEYRKYLSKTPKIYHEPFYCEECTTIMRQDLLDELHKIYNTNSTYET